MVCSGVGRVWGVAGVVVVGLVLAGCIRVSPPPVASVANYRDASVTVTITGAEVEPLVVSEWIGATVYGEDGRQIEGFDDCVGDGFVVTDTVTGRVLGSFEEPVCGDTLIRVAEDGTVTN